MGTRLNSRWKRRFTLTLAGMASMLAAFYLVRLSFMREMASTTPLPRVVYQAGFTQDLSILLLSAGMGALLGALFRIPRYVGTIAFGLVCWVSTVIYAAYFGFFHTRLDWWVVKQHIHDFGQVAGAGFRIGNQWQLIASAVAFVAGCALMVLGHRAGKGGEPKASKKRERKHEPWYRGRLQTAGLAALFIVFGLFAKQSPVWFKWVHRDPARGGFRANVAGEHIIFVWYDQTYGYPEGFEADKQLLVGVDSPHDKIDAFSALDKAGAEKTSTAELRAHLGLPKDGPIHILLVFIESARGYEWVMPELSSTVLPNLTGLLKTHGKFFEQAYSSSLEPGQTARGLHSTLCGRLPNIGGPAVFIAYNHIKVGCLPEVLGNGGYETISIQPFNKNYHNAQYFESLHGTQKFFDKQDVFAREPDAKRIIWGSDEGPYFRQAFEIASEEIRANAAVGKPLFAHLRTNSTHYPFHVDTDLKLPKEFSSKLKEQEYVDYLTSYHYTDRELAGFVKKVLAAPYGDRTLLVVMGDHSLLRETGADRPLQDFQRREIQARIPLMLFTRNMPKPERISRPVHQMDVSRTIAHLAGLAPHTDWLGAGLFGKRSNLWVFSSDRGVSYRTQDRLCLAGLRPGKKTTCLKIGANEDPFKVSSPAEIAEDPQQAKFYDEVIRADRYLIHHNRIRRPESALTSGS